ncbi:hypothetical protein HG535_0C04600 [Zygotorulaspora mrakii]|uniref:DUF1776-domain-containing protein n=1 Tax=Zygotorulaspora mrakii TaxID=42260 RepID=A0A7H9B112_ZYGMR|nr:uncharacterized protein HG535_0C04600 [Zygotorulaspora mrakii]QLG72106.1 hypothetical protein HG535_0C04600 [Zygotorulaspora mrakii]
MSSQDQDVIDKIFSTGYSLLASGNKVVSDAANKIIDNVSRIGTEAGNKRFEVKSVGTVGRSGRSPLDWVSRRKNGIFWGLGLTAMGMLLWWQVANLVKVPSSLPQHKKKCVLVLGDMRDPIIRSQVMDLYRRRFVVFVCPASVTKRSNYENQQEEDDFLRFIGPSSSSDLANFVEFVTKKGEDKCELASVLFMPNLSYYPTGEMSVGELNSEIQTNVSVYYTLLTKLLPHLTSKNTQLLLFNPSLSYNMSISHHSVEILISGLMQGVYRSLKNHKRVSTYMIHIGMLQVAAQPSNYKYLSIRGSNINDDMLLPVYRLIASHQGNWLLRLGNWIRTFGSLNRNVYCGKRSYISGLPFSEIIALLIN